MLLDQELEAALSATESVRFIDRVAGRQFGEVRAELRAEALAGAQNRVYDDELSVRSGQVPRADGTPLALRIYSPRDATDLLPGLLFFHGGGFMVGNLDSEDRHCREYAARAHCVVVSVDYRLAPEHPFPAGLLDCCTAIEWLASHAGQIGVDAQRVGVVGVSAGGALAAGSALWARDSSVQMPLRLQMLLYPVMDDRMETPSMRECVSTPVWEAASNRLMWERYLPDGLPSPQVRSLSDLSMYAAPGLATDVSRVPRTLVLTAGADPLRDEGIAFVMRLEDAGGQVELHHFANGFHGFDMHFPDVQISQRAIDAQVSFLCRAWSGLPPLALGG